VIGGDSRARVIHGDCLEQMRAMEPNSVDAIVCDPPYGLSFMGKNWDHGIPGVAFWAEALRVAKPGAHLVAFGGSRTFHRLACAIEDAGWEIRDTLSWLYGSGFPKSADVSKHLDAQERKAWLDVGKALDNIDQSAILEAWKEHSSTAKSAGLSFAKSATATGTATPASDSVPSPVLLSTNHAKSPASVLIAELHSSEAQRTDAGCWRSVLSPAGGDTTASSALVTIAGSSHESPEAKLSTAGSTVPRSAWAWASESMAGRLRAVEALRTWLGSKPSSRQAATAALCAALTDDLKRITLSQSETFRRSDTTQQTDCVSAIAATITASTAASLISFTADTLRAEALDKAAGAERETVGFGDVRRASQTQPFGQGATQDVGIDTRAITAPATDAAKQWAGWGTALKPAWEPIILARKPLSGTVAQTVTQWGTGAINVDACRIGHSETLSGGTGTSGKHEGWDRPWMHDGTARENYRSTAGRWPANVVLSHAPECREVGTRKVKGSHHEGPPGRRGSGFVDTGHGRGDPRPNGPSYADADGTETVPAWACAESCPVRLMDEQSGERPATARHRKAVAGRPKFDGKYNNGERYDQGADVGGGYGDTGGASRFFLTVKGERCESASIAEPTSTPSSPPGASALNGAATPEALGGKPPAPSPLTPASTGSSPDSTPTPSHALSAVSQDSTGTIPTTPSRCESCGSALPATDALTSSANGAAVEVANVQVEGTRFRYEAKASRREREAGLEGMPRHERKAYGGAPLNNAEHECSDGVQRTGEREPSRNVHPTVKPLALMRWLCRLVTPPGGVILDPFTGSGSTGCAAVLEGFRFLGIEQDAEYVAIAERRIAHWAATVQPEPQTDLLAEPAA
jgi:DNA modification methylase